MDGPIDHCLVGLAALQSKHVFDFVLTTNLLTAHLDAHHEVCPGGELQSQELLLPTQTDKTSLAPAGRQELSASMQWK